MELQVELGRFECILFQLEFVAIDLEVVLRLARSSSSFSTVSRSTSSCDCEMLRANLSFDSLERFISARATSSALSAYSIRNSLVAFA